MAVIVGVDGSEHARHALAWAADAARLRGEPLRVVHIRQLAVLPGAYGGWEPVPELEDDVRAEAEAELRRWLTDAGTSFDGVDVTDEVVGALSPAEALLDRAGPGDVLVVGSRGRGGFAGLLLGSVSQQVVRHAPCAVVVVPAGAR